MPHNEIMKCNVLSAHFSLYPSFSCNQFSQPNLKTLCQHTQFYCVLSHQSILFSRPIYVICITRNIIITPKKSASGMLINPGIVFTFIRAKRWNSTTLSLLLILVTLSLHHLQFHLTAASIYSYCNPIHIGT
jgi:hypothetical protein